MRSNSFRADPLRAWLVPALLLMASCGGGGSSGDAGGAKADEDGGVIAQPDLASLPSTCGDGKRDGSESDVDCGGSECLPCVVGGACLRGADCASGLCTNNVCSAPSCDDGVENGDETDSDCGGSCAPCGSGKHCLRAGDCQGGLCQNNTCTSTDPCDVALASPSYLGCEFFPTVTVNSQLTNTAAHFAVVIANPNATPVDVSISRGGIVQSQVQIGARSVQSLTLPWVAALQQSGGALSPAKSVLSEGGAYRLVASLPIAAYQFNPLESDTGGSTYTYTNDASLLLPTGALTGDYLVIARPTSMTNIGSSWGTLSGFFTVVAAEPGSTRVSIKFTAPTLASSDGTVAAYSAGAIGNFTLAQGDALQLLSAAPTSCTPQSQDDAGQYCDLGAAYDLTGTAITGDKKLAVYSGHDCAFVPFDKWACDHLEESIPPVESWGKRYLAAHSQRNPASIPDVWRVVSAQDGNTITFDPPSVHAPVTLARGQWAEFASTSDFQASGTGAFALAQFMAGENYVSSSAIEPGDPSLALAAPVEQYRASYTFLAPSTYTQNYVNLTAPAGVAVTLDGALVDTSAFSAVGTSGYGAARLAIAAGPHTITAAQPFGITVYGLASYSSYMVPGGYDAKHINP